MAGGILLLAGAGVALTVTGFLPKLLGMKPPEGTMAAEQEKAKPAEPIVPERYFDMPPIVISLESQGQGNRIMQLGLSLLMETREEASNMHSYMPLLIDAVQVYIRGLPSSETSSVARLNTHRAELLARINAAIAPMKADEINLRQVQQQ
ncbi:MAG TPA: flagellar basal body-associated FliL family protein [Aliidongia sp.]|nr:flagellar basal body-associated FliL family protein [Aliidongia sp.]